MKISQILNLKILFLIGVMFILSCLATAKMSDFPASTSDIDFEKYAREFKNTETPFWTFKTSNEFYFEKKLLVSEVVLLKSIKQSLEEKGYQIIVFEKENRRIIGKRKMKANEWNSITGVYYRLSTDKLQLYITTKITQDITGGWEENRAKKLGELIENTLNSY